MGARGPKPVHPAIRAHAARQAATGGARFKPGTPDCPSWLSEGALKLWRRVVGELEAGGALALIDAELVASYCSTLADLAAVSQAIDRAGVVIDVPTFNRNGRPTGHSMSKPNPLLKTKDTLTGRMKQLADALGIGHTIRSRQNSSGGEPPRAENKVIAIRDRIEAARAANKT